MPLYRHDSIVIGPSGDTNNIVTAGHFHHNFLQNLPEA